MTRDELLDLIAEVQDPRSELTDVDVKTAEKGTPQHLYEPLSAFANRTGGGADRAGLAQEPPRRRTSDLSWVQSQRRVGGAR